MPEATTTTSLKAVFGFPFEGRDSRNRFIIGSALTLAGFIVPIIPGIFVYGYILRAMRQVLDGEELSLPAWTDWGQLFVDGLRGIVVSLVYLLPGIIVMVAGMTAYFISIFALPFMTNSAGGDAWAGLLILGSMAVMFLTMAIGSLLMLLGAIPLPMATAHFVAEDKVAAGFHLRAWWAILRANKMGYFIDWVIIIGLSGIAYMLMMVAYYSMILCILVPFLSAPVVFYVMLVGAALFSQTYRDGAAAMEAGETATE